MNPPRTDRPVFALTALIYAFAVVLAASSTAAFTAGEEMETERASILDLPGPRTDPAKIDYGRLPRIATNLSV